MNLAINGFRAISTRAKNFVADAHKVWKTEEPVKYMFMTDDAREAMRKARRQKENYRLRAEDISLARTAALGLGAYAVADTAYRAISGGSMYRNRTGQKDFVGIPFI